jgi:hypothetical protein
MQLPGAAEREQTLGREARRLPPNLEVSGEAEYGPDAPAEAAIARTAAYK